MPLTADDRIILIKVKIERAKKCLLDLKSELKGFGLRRFYTADFRKHRILPFDTIAIAGDVVHNLRSALDHLAHQLVLVGSGAEPNHRVAFPISENAAAYERHKARKVEGMSLEAIKAIDALKPYKGGDDTLWQISVLDNIDKHRNLFTYAHDCYLAADWLKEFSPHPYRLKATNPAFVGVGDSASESSSEDELESEIDEVVRKPKRATKKMLPTLTRWIDHVEKLVMGFKPFLKQR
jgi:hypothetical protein